MHTIRITCDCDVCATNARALGLPLPLAADWTPKTPKAVKALRGAQARHGLVFTAHDPTFVGQAARSALGVEAVTS